MSLLSQTLSPALQRLGEVSVRLSVELGRTDMALKDVLSLSEGSVVSLDRLADELLDITANGQVIAHGEVIAQDGRFALRIVSLAGGEDAGGSASRSVPKTVPTNAPTNAPRSDGPSPSAMPSASPEPTGGPAQSEGIAPEASPSDGEGAQTEESAEQSPTEATAETPFDEPDVDDLLDALDELGDAPAAEGDDASSTDAAERGESE
ncbi:MAG: flagellar motor switch protein FliN [Pseudomonadota bacterium]